jgi:hypothetical protein
MDKFFEKLWTKRNFGIQFAFIIIISIISMLIIWGSGKYNYALDKLYFRTNKCVTK